MSIRSIDKILESINSPVGINNDQKTRYSGQFIEALNTTTVATDLKERMEDIVNELNVKIERAGTSEDTNTANQKVLESKFSSLHKDFGPPSAGARLNVAKQTMEAIALKEDLTNSRDLLQELIPLVETKLAEQQTATDAAAIEADREGDVKGLAGGTTRVMGGKRRRNKRTKRRKASRKATRRHHKRR